MPAITKRSLNGKNENNRLNDNNVLVVNEIT